MKTEQIAEMLMDNIANDKAKIEELKVLFSKAVDSVLKSSLEVILSIENEAQGKEVVMEISKALISDDDLEKWIKLPFWAEPFDGLAIKQGRPILTGIILNFIDVNILDKVAGKNWFEKLQNYAKQMIEVQ
jgi:hypothetical protein